MKTRIIKLKNGDMKITLCGAIHVGTQNYFNQLNGIADKSDVVLFEGVKAITLDKLKTFYIKLGQLIGFKIQNRNGYENSPKWINSDMNYEIIKHYMKKNIIEDLDINGAIEELEDLNREDDDESTKKFIRWLILFLIKRLSFISLFIRENHVLVRLRNYKVLIDITEQFETHNDIAVVYGDGHLNHLIKNLNKMNFKIIEKSYLDSFK